MGDLCNVAVELFGPNLTTRADKVAFIDDRPDRAAPKGDGEVVEGTADMARLPWPKPRLVEARAASAPVFEQLVRGLDRRDCDRLLRLLGRFYDNLEGA